MIFARSEHPLHRLQAFVEGVKCSEESRDNAEVGIALAALKEVPKHIIKCDDQDSDTIGWFDELMKRHEGSEERAFEEFLAIARKLAGEESMNE
jgi:hypothetical protein